MVVVESSPPVVLGAVGAGGAWVATVMAGAVMAEAETVGATAAATEAAVAMAVGVAVVRVGAQRWMAKPR